MDGNCHFIVFLLFVRCAIGQNCDCKLVNILRNIVQREMMEREMLVSRVEMLESQGLQTYDGANSSEYSSDTVILERLFVLESMMENFKTNLKEIKTNECASNPCWNGATCVDGIQSYTCICLAGYSGSQCQIKNNVCASNPCMNGATCLEVMNNFACKCAFGYEGTNCQIGSLGTTQCMNNTNVIEGDSRTCGEVFGNESTCVQGKCACSDGYVPNLINTACEQGSLGTTQCVDNTNVIKGDSRTCREVFGSESLCVLGKCACSDSYVPKLNNNTACEKGSLGTTQCVDNTNVIKGDSRTCGEVFGSESICVHGKCACSAGYVPNLTNTVCEQGYLGITDCDAHNNLVRSYIRTCEQVFGTGTTCVQGKCVCSAAGYVSSLTITGCVKVNEAYGRTPMNTLHVTNGASFGDWGNPAYCPPGTFATGYIMRIEPHQGWNNKGPENDDTSLNAIRLVCADLGGMIKSQIGSLEGVWGDWTPEESCHKGTFLVSFKLQVESFLGGNYGEDDTSANYVKFHCRDFAGKNGQTELVRSPGYGFWGEWGGWSQTCVPNSAICGLRTKVESYKVEGDDTALNDVIFYCCNQLY